MYACAPYTYINHKMHTKTVPVVVSNLQVALDMEDGEPWDLHLLPARGLGVALCSRTGKKHTRHQRQALDASIALQAAVPESFLLGFLPVQAG